MAVFSNEEKTFVINDDGTVNEVSGRLRGREQKSVDGTKAAFIVSDTTWSAGTLYYASGKGAPVKVAEDVLDFVLSDSGEGMAFYVNYDPSAYVADLMVYDVKDAQAHAIDHNAYYRDSGDYYYNFYHYIGSYAVISPDGKSVMYKADYENGEHTLKINVNGKSDTVGRNADGIAVADGAKFMYFTKTTDTGTALYASKGTDAQEVRLDRVSTGVSYNRYHFNADYSQIVFVNADGRTCISVRGGDKSNLANSVVVLFLVPDNARFRAYEGGYDAHNVYVYGFGDFKNSVFLSGNGELNAIDGKLEKQVIAGDVSIGNSTVSKDGKWVYYVNYSGILKKASASDSTLPAQTVASGVSDFVLAPDGDTVYYITLDGELYQKKSGAEGRGTKIDGNAYVGYDYDAILISGDGKVYFLSDVWAGKGTLYGVSGTKKNRVRDDVYGVYAGARDFYYFVDGETYYDVYVINDGKTPKIAARDVTEIRLG
ncbi:MAG: hypothetical protein LBI36_00710 [Oscillospiraceae bacterium]|nr:hypothetical protein [Oscillospiraceae bacterium]